MNDLSLNGHTYSMRPMDPLMVLVDSGKLGDVVAPIFSMLNKDDFEMGLPALLLKSGGALVKQFKNPEFISVAEDLFKLMAVDGKEFAMNAPSWKHHFLGKTGDMPQVIAWALAEQFGDFFKGVRDGMTKSLSSLVASAA